jgi:hypothetical protein
MKSPTDQIEHLAASRRMPIFLVAMLVAVLSVTGCAGERQLSSRALTVAALQTVGLIAGPTCGDFYLDQISSTFSFGLDSDVADQTSGLTVEMTFPDNITTPIMATYEVVIIVPPEFTFLGFDALGVESVIGAWEFDFPATGVFEISDFTIDHRGLDIDSAYSDSDASGALTPAIDPTAEYTTGVGGEHIITLTLPDGGIEPINGNCTYFSFDARYTLLDGIVRLPSTPGSYDIQIMATSVDLDTGNASDDIAPDPLTFSDTFVVAVPEPQSILLAGTSLVTILTMAALRRRPSSQDRR